MYFMGEGRGEGSSQTRNNYSIEKEPSPCPLPAYRERRKSERRRATRALYNTGAMLRDWLAVGATNTIDVSKIRIILPTT